MLPKVTNISLQVRKEQVIRQEPGTSNVPVGELLVSGRVHTVFGTIIKQTFLAGNVDFEELSKDLVHGFSQVVFPIRVLRINSVLVIAGQQRRAVFRRFLFVFEIVGLAEQDL